MTTPTREEALAHFGVKGMKWGVRGSESSSSGDSQKKGLSDKQKKALKVGAGAVAVAGAAAAVYVLSKNGKVKISDIDRHHAQNAKRLDKHHAKNAKNLSKHMNKQDLNLQKYLSQDVWRQDVNSLIADMQKAGAEHDLNARRTLNSMPSVLTNERSRKLVGL